MEELLSQLGRATTGRCGAPVIISVNEGGKMPPDVQLALYRIAQEALNNAANHAAAGQITVDFSSEPGRAELVVTDDGQGFDIDNIPPDHFGLQIMNERAEAIGGTLTVNSRPGAGSKIAIQWSEKSLARTSEMTGDKEYI